MMLWLDLILEPASIDAVKLARCLFGIWLERTGRGCAWWDQYTTRQESERCRTVGEVRHRRREFSSWFVTRWGPNSPFSNQTSMVPGLEQPNTAAP